MVCCCCICDLPLEFGAASGGENEIGVSALVIVLAIALRGDYKTNSTRTWPVFLEILFPPRLGGNAFNQTHRAAVSSIPTWLNFILSKPINLPKKAKFVGVWVMAQRTFFTAAHPSTIVLDVAVVETKKSKPHCSPWRRVRDAEQHTGPFSQSTSPLLSRSFSVEVATCRGLAYRSTTPAECDQALIIVLFK